MFEEIVQRADRMSQECLLGDSLPKQLEISCQSFR